MCMVADDDFWEFYNEYTPKAKVPHICGECGRTIGKGERYRTQGGKNDGSFVWFKTCLHCDKASEWLVAVCGGWIFNRRLEDFLEHVTGHEKEVRSRPLVRLVRWMKAGWTDRNGNLRSTHDVDALVLEALGAWKAQLQAALHR